MDIGLTTAQVEHVVLLLIFAFLAARGQVRRLSVRTIGKFQDLTADLLSSESYLELLYVFQTHVTTFFNIYHGNLWTRRVRDKCLPRLNIDSFVHSADANIAKVQPNVVRRLLEPVVSLLPESKAEIAIAANIARNVLLSRGFVGFLARSRPYFALEVLQHLMTPGQKFFRDEFVALYRDGLISHKAGIFYSELANNQTSRSPYRYLMPSNNRLLRFLFVDAQTANQLQIWRPVGGFMLRELDRLAREPESDPYNTAYTANDSWQRESPLFAGVQFFEIMVSEALFQEIKSHMWLYYTTYWVTRIVRNYQPGDDPLIRPDVSNPIWYSHLLYVIFSALRDWILAWQELPTQGRPERMKDEITNISTNSIVALGTCLYSVLCSDKLEDKLRDSLADLVFGIYRDLRGTLRGDQYAIALLNSIRSGGFTTDSNWRSTYRARVLATIQRQDSIDFREYEGDLAAAFT